MSSSITGLERKFLHEQAELCGSKCPFIVFNEYIYIMIMYMYICMFPAQIEDMYVVLLLCGATVREDPMVYHP
jgi:hypothetical protein